jgi:hydroxyacylglutathione hydrolase
MTISIHTFVLGPIQNNTYLVVDDETRQAVLIDPAAPSKQIASLIEEKGLQLKYMLITHAHFDHIGGVKWFQSLSNQPIPVALHSLDLDLWKAGGGSKDFGFEFDPGQEPDLIVCDQQLIPLGKTTFKVLFTPGHSFGHVTYLSLENRAAFCGDLIFYHGVGRTDLDVCNEEDLYTSIREKIFTLPDDTFLYPGHGKKTSVKEEKENNPFL